MFDNENLNLTVSLPASAAENIGVLTNAGVVSISGTLTTNLPVSLVSGNPGKLSVPSLVTIPAGQVSSAFSLTLVDNSIADGQTNVTVTASAAGFTNGTASILVTDDESPTIPFNPRPGNFATNILANTNLQWSSITTTTVTNELILNGNFESGSLTNWTTVAGVSGTFVINNGTVDPPSPDGPLPPFAGSYSALGRESGGGIFYMYQTILIPSNVVSAQLSWAHRVRNFYTAFSSSQQFQVRITDTNNVVLATAFTTGPSNTLLGGWVQTNYNLIAQAGKKVRVMFWVNPGSYYLDAHVDSVSVQVTTSSNATPVGILTNDVYFGTNPAPGPAELQGSTTNSAWTLPLLAPLTTYYWQIVAHKVGAATSPVWQFTTAGVDHFAWNTIPSPQFVNQPFSATITAQDKFNSIVSNYAGQVSLTAGVPGFGTQFGENFETGNFSGWLNGAGSYTRSVVNNTAAGGNYSFTLIGGNSAHYDGISHVLSNLTPSRITFSVRAGATNVAGGYFVVGTGPAVASNAIFFYMTSLGMDVYDGSTHHLVPYVANQWYKVAFLLNWTGKTVDYYVNDILQYTGIPFRGAVNNLSVLYLYNFNSTQAWWDEITFDNGNASSSLTISPTNSANFINGAWNGNIVVQQPATNVVLRADDGGSHSGASNPFDVNLTNDLAIRIVDSPHPVSVGATLTYTLAVTNTGPADATGVTLTNILPPNVTFISANSSQGTCVQNSNVITCDLGLVPGGTNAIITILVTPTIAGVSLTNVATISRAETDNYLGNNSATVITPVTTPTISIADAALVEGNIGTTNLLFNVTLATPSAQTITVNYATVAGSAVAGSDYLTTNGVLTFTPGITNGIISVAVLGDIQVETNETFLVNLSNPANGTLGRAQAVGTIINDDGFAGYVDHFVWSAIASPQFASQGFAVTISALDSSNNIATNFSGAVALSSANAAISPAVSDNFSNGIWSGSIAVLQRVTNTVLTANDGNGHFGLSNPFEVAPTNLPPVILSQPTNQTIFVGGSATFGVIADGTPPLGFQWSVNGTNIPGATGSLIALTNTMFNQAGLYAVMVTNNYGFNLSSNALLTVNPPPPCVPPSTGLVGWWPGEGNGSDVVGTNTASLTGGVTFAAGEVGQAFSLNSNTVVKATASPSLDVGQANGFTLEAWIKPTDVTQARPLFEWNNSSGWGAHFYIAPGQPGTATPGPGQLYANIVDIFGSWHQMSSPGGTVASNVFQHVALTYDKSSGLAAIYYNGQIVSQQNFGSFTPLTAFDFYLGRRPAPSAEVADFEGLIDEPSIYNRALATNEIANIFNAGVAGKCAPNHPPVAGSTFTLGANIGVLATVKIIGGKHSPTDVDNDPLTITAVSGAVNGTTSTDGTNVTYIATGGTNDSFNCTISDGRGGTAIQTVNVVITASGGLGYNQLSAQSLGGGTNVLTFLGTPGFNYALDRTTNLVPPVVWISQGIKAASSNGFLIFTNVTPLSPVFYRTRYVP